MRLLLANKFFHLRGGAEKVFFEEAALLAAKGHQVGYFSMHHPLNRPSQYSRYFVSQVDYDRPLGFAGGLRAAGRLLYSFEARARLRQLLTAQRFDLAHLHNICHQLSPSIIDELHQHGIPVVMTMHDFKMVCPTYLMLNRDQPCDRCSQGAYWHCLSNRCKQDSWLRSGLNTLEMYLHHRLLKIYDKVSLFVSPSRFLRDKVQHMGFKRPVVYLPNFVQSRDFQPSFDWQDGSLVYLGRLSREKGLRTLIDAVAGLPVNLKVLGDGPLRAELEAHAAHRRVNNVRFLGFLEGRALAEEVRRSRFAVCPSEWYENHPLAVLEAFAWGKPVVGARLGGIPELVQDGETGLTFEPGNWRDLKEKFEFLLEQPKMIIKMGRRSRRLVEEEFNPENHYLRLMEIYHSVILGQRQSAVAEAAATGSR